MATIVKALSFFLLFLLSQILFEFIYVLFLSRYDFLKCCHVTIDICPASLSVVLLCVWTVSSWLFLSRHVKSTAHWDARFELGKTISIG